MKPYTIILVLIWSLMACSKNKIDIQNLVGVWIEDSQKKDSIEFTTLLNNSCFILNRERVLYNGLLQPKSKSGPYTYKINNNNKIQLQWFLSSSINNSQYHFKVKGNRLEIGNFYDASLSNILVFHKIE